MWEVIVSQQEGDSKITDMTISPDNDIYHCSQFSNNFLLILNIITTMKYLFIILFSITFLACSDEHPECVDTRISQFKMDQADCPLATIKKYSFQDQIVYGFTDGNCIADGGTTIIDDSCQQLCFLGGIAGLTDCEGVNFNQNAEELELIWENQ